MPWGDYSARQIGLASISTACTFLFLWVFWTWNVLQPNYSVALYGDASDHYTNASDHYINASDQEINGDRDTNASDLYDNTSDLHSILGDLSYRPSLLELTKAAGSLFHTSNYQQTNCSLPKTNQANKRLLIVIAAYNRQSALVVASQMKAFNQLCEEGFEVHVLLLTCSSDWLRDPLLLETGKGTYCQRTSRYLDFAVVLFEQSVTWQLLGIHRVIIKGYIESYDWFLHLEDDHYLTTDNLRYLVHYDNILPFDTLPFLFRFEEVQHGTGSEGLIGPARPLKLVLDRPLTGLVKLLNTTEGPQLFYTLNSSRAYTGYWFLSRRRLKPNLWLWGPGPQFNILGMEYYTSAWQHKRFTVYPPSGLWEWVVPIDEYFRHRFIQHMSDKYSQSTFQLRSDNRLQFTPKFWFVISREEFITKVMSCILPEALREPVDPQPKQLEWNPHACWNCLRHGGVPAYTHDTNIEIKCIS